MESNRPRVLMVDENEDILEMVSSGPGDAGKEYTVAKNSEFAQGMMSILAFDLVLLHIPLPGRAGIEIFTGLKRRFPECTLMVTTAVSDMDMAIAAMQEGAMDYEVKPFDLDDLDRRGDRALERSGAKPRPEIESEARLIVKSTQDDAVLSCGYDRSIGGLEDITRLMGRLEGEIQKTKPPERDTRDCYRAPPATRHET